MTTATTKSQATRTRNNAKSTARSAASTVRNARTTATRQGREVRDDLGQQSKRVIRTARDEVNAVRSQPARPLWFALGLTDRTVGVVRDLPSGLTPSRTRQRVTRGARSVGDFTERARRNYSDVAKDGERLGNRIRRQESTQEATRLAERSQDRARLAVKDAEKSASAAVDATQESAGKFG